MLLVPKQVHRSCFFVFALVLNLTFLASFGGSKFALADPFAGPDERYPAPPVSPWNVWDRMFGIGVRSDYPGDFQLRINFLGTDPDQTLVMAITVNELSRYREYCTTPSLGLNCVFDAFPSGYLLRGDRSRRWFRDFYFRYNNIYLRAAEGIAHILVSDIYMRTRCDYFTRIIGVLLRNEKVDRIILVNAADWNRQRVWVDRRREDDNDDDDDDGGPIGLGTNSDDGGNGNNPGPGSNALGAATLILPATGGSIGVTSDAIGAVNAVKSIPPASQIFSGDGKDKDQGVNPLNFPLKTDILDSPMASLPSSDDIAAGTDKELRISSKDETSVPKPQIDDTSSTSTTDYLTADNEDSNFKNLFQRRWRTLLPRDGQNCLDWLTDSDFPDSPDSPIQPSAPAAGTSSNPIAAPSVQTDGNLEHYVEKLNIGVKEEVATLLVTQYDRSSSNPDFTLDIKVSDSLGNMLHYEQHVDAPSGKEIKVSLSDPKGSFLWPLYLTTGNNKEDPLQIEYGDILLIGPQTDWGTTFDSSDPRQQCTVSPWTDSKREIQCSIIVARHSS